MPIATSFRKLFARAEVPVFLERLRGHFEREPSTLPVVAEQLDRFEHPNVHLALEACLARAGGPTELVGVTRNDKYQGLSLGDLVTAYSDAVEAPVEYVNIHLDEARVLTCVQRGLYLAGGPHPLAALVHGPKDWTPFPKITVEAMACERSTAERFLGDLRSEIRKQNVYRGRVVSLGCDRMGTLEIAFHQLPAIERSSIILPDGLLDRIERQTVRFGRLSQKLLAARRHLKRGLLLHGAPGTGKTLTAMYLARECRDRTVLLLTGRGFGLIEQSCRMARALQPSIVILEDVDLVAEERTRREPSCGTPLLFELLNEMDGLADDADVLFLLTTNRPDLLEPALASRPGRIDQAIDFPLPDAHCRHRLFELYGRGLRLNQVNMEQFVQRSEGASAAFIRELMRKAALFAAEEATDSDELIVEDRHIDEALRELVVYGGDLTKSLLGYRPTTSPRA